MSQVRLEGRSCSSKSRLAMTSGLVFFALGKPRQGFVVIQAVIGAGCTCMGAAFNRCLVCHTS